MTEQEGVRLDGLKFITADFSGLTLKSEPPLATSTCHSVKSALQIFSRFCQDGHVVCLELAHKPDI